MIEKKILLAIIISTVLILVGAIFYFSKSESSKKTPKEDVISANGLHWHPILSIYIEGKKQNIPVDVGILPTKHEEIHTHEDADKGILHMEMTGIVTKNETRLGRFFEIWGKTFISSQIFENKNSTDSTVKMFVNGKANSDFENYLMKDGDKIEIRYE